jgi:hypothetical protein
MRGVERDGRTRKSRATQSCVTRLAGHPLPRPSGELIAHKIRASAKSRAASPAKTPVTDFSGPAVSSFGQV